MVASPQSQQRNPFGNHKSKQETGKPTTDFLSLALGDE
jgi:hypothetical protein